MWKQNGNVKLYKQFNESFKYKNSAQNNRDVSNIHLISFLISFA